MSVTKEQILSFSDIKTKEIEVPVWDVKMHIRQLTRGQQDEYMKRQLGGLAVKQRGKAQEIEQNIQIYGHDAWIFVQGVCDEEGKRLFSDGDIPKINEKNGEAVGFVSSAIIEFSGMGQDVKDIEQLKN